MGQRLINALRRRFGLESGRGASGPWATAGPARGSRLRVGKGCFQGEAGTVFCSPVKVSILSVKTSRESMGQGVGRWGQALLTICVAWGRSAQVSQHKGLSFLVIRMEKQS